MTLALLPAPEIARRLADRIRQARLDLEWGQAETAERAGVALATYRKFESTGQASLGLVISVSVALGRSADWEQLITPRPHRVIEDVVATWNVRQRGRRRPSKKKADNTIGGGSGAKA